MGQLAHAGVMCPSDLLLLFEGVSGLMFALCWVKVWWHHRTHHQECDK